MLDSNRIQDCGYYEILPEFAKDLMAWRVESLTKATVDETPLREVIDNEAQELSVEIKSITIRDSFLWSPAPDDIDIYVVVTGDERHKKVFNNLQITIPHIRMFVGDVWFVGNDAINDLQKTWMYRRGVTIEGTPFTELPADPKVYLGLAVAKGLSEATTYRDQSNYHKMVHRLLAAAYYGAILYSDDPARQNAHRYIAKKLLNIMHTDSNYGDVLRREYGQAMGEIRTLNHGVLNEFFATMELIKCIKKLKRLNKNERSIATALSVDVFSLFPDSEATSIAEQIDRCLRN